jgi:hypothetical protein
MYHQGRINASLFKKVVSTYGMTRTSSKLVMMVYSGGVYQLKKESRSLKDAIHHHMEDIMGHSILMQKIGNVDFSGQLCMKTQKIFIRRCGACQRHGNINTRDVMPLTNNLQIELFDVWGIDYMGPFPKSK